MLCEIKNFNFPLLKAVFYGILEYPKSEGILYRKQKLFVCV